ncbi:MAG: T9SS type A sorting domain-containing protein, partial [Saprospiraceae bacterium]|nr:T9SS type A sorting domain-containing protein [Saprospiraceae bacterium]
FTNYLLGPDGTEYVFSHGQAPFRTVMTKRVPGGSWVDSNVPTATPSGTLWARAAIGGADGQTIHLIATTTPTGNGGVEYQGMNGVVLYYRSKDGGATWDITDQLLPGINSDNFTGTEVEGYAVDANGDNVSIFITNTWNDCIVFISENNGDTWTPRIVNDFPLTRYVVNTGYDPAILPVDPNAPVPEAIFTCDGSADVLVDASGITHCFYGSTYVNDIDTTDTGWTFYPGSNVGIVYWNSTMDDNDGVSAGYCPDINGNDTLDVTDISNYGYGLNTHPSAAIDQDGNLYLTYATVHELYVDVNAGMNFRKPYIVASTDLGATWNLPKPILDDELLQADSSEAPYIEAIFTSTAKVANDKVHCTFQADYAVFNFVNDATNEIPDGDATDNSIRYVGYPTAWALVNTKNVAPEALKFEIMPNPASDQVLVQYTSDRAQTANVELYDMFGNMVRKTTRASVGAGSGAAQINTADLPNGMYFVRLNLGNSFATRKLTVQH